MSEQTEHELRLVAGVMGFELCTCADRSTMCDRWQMCAEWQNPLCTCDGKRTFRPLHDERDLARLVEAMNKAGYDIIRSNTRTGCKTTVVYPDTGQTVFGDWKPTDRETTYRAIVEALVEKEERDGS